MSLGNLHGIVRGIINTVNPDITAVYLASTGQSTDANYKTGPTYAAPVSMGAQSQPITTRDIRRYDFLSGQGVFRAVYLFGNLQAIVRSMQLGGDLLKFPQFKGAPVETWLISAVDETWTPDNGWCRVICTLQLDPSNPS